MGSESMAPMAETSKNRSSSGKMNQVKVPKRIHKAEREKMKREHLNELFLDLANALDLNEQNNGKASILCETARLLKDLLCQIESLKKENVSLLSESHYVTMEKNELKEENSSLETQIEKLQCEIQAKVAQYKPDLNVPPQLELESPEQTYFPGQSLQSPSIDPTLQQGPAVLVVPFRPDLQGAFPAPNVTELAPKPTSVISKPNPRPVISLVYPLYASVRAIESKSPIDDQQWLTYWVLYSLITLFELTFAKLLEWIPIWPYAKLIGTCWLVLPYFSGAAYVYDHYVRPLFVNPQTINIWYVPKKKDAFSKPDDILTAAEKYIQENGTEAFQNMIHRADKSRRSGSSHHTMYEESY